MSNRVFQYRKLSLGDVFSIIHERDERRYMKLGQHGAVNVNTRDDCIPAPRDRCVYHYSVRSDNSIHRRVG